MGKSSVDVQSITISQQMVSSGAGAILVSLFMTPFDVVKVRLQAQDASLSRPRCFLYSNGLMDHVYTCLNNVGQKVVCEGKVLSAEKAVCNCRWYNRPKYFQGTYDAFVKISKVEGPASLWSGLSPTLVLAMPTTVVYFTSYEHLKLFFVKFIRPEVASLLSGAVARIVAVTFVSPLELARTKMQAREMSLSQVWHTLTNMVRLRGFSALWQGYSATLFRDVPFSALYWPVYETSKGAVSKVLKEDSAASFTSGAFAGAICSVVTLPMDVVKTRQQIDMGKLEFANSTESATKPANTYNVLRTIVREQGAKALFSGLTPRVLKVAPACAIMIASYEYFKTVFAARNQSWNM